VDFSLQDGHTPVIVTADHETRGLTLPEAGKTSPEPGALSTAPVAGIVRSIRFDPERHEFVIVIAATTQQPQKSWVSKDRCTSLLTHVHPTIVSRVPDAHLSTVRESGSLRLTNWRP